MYENPQLNVCKNKKFLREVSNNSPNDLLGMNVYKTLESF